MLRNKMVEQLRLCIKEEVKKAITNEERRSITEGKNCITPLSTLQSDYANLSDHEVLEIIPYFAETFQHAMETLENADMPDDKKYNALLHVSNMRQKMDIDKRWREIHKGMIL